MIKTLAIPQNNSYNLAIPNDYIGRKIEILFYALDEIVEEKVEPKMTMADFCGILSDSDYSSLKKHTEQARTEWDRTI
jgi:hypothetical protein